MMCFLTIWSIMRMLLACPHLFSLIDLFSYKRICTIRTGPKQTPNTCGEDNRKSTFSDSSRRSTVSEYSLALSDVIKRLKQSVSSYVLTHLHQNTLSFFHYLKI